MYNLRFLTKKGKLRLQLRIKRFLHSTFYILHSSEGGQVLVLVIVVLAVVLGSTLLTIGGAQLYHSNSTYTLEAEKATGLAEAGADKALQSLNSTGGSYSGEAETVLGDGSYSVTITSKDAATKVIQATGYIPNKLKPKAKRIVRVEASRGVGISFTYGVQVGEGGLELGNNNIVNGSVYSNGNVTAGNNNVVTGDVWVAGGQQPTADQQTDCDGSNCQDYLFGRNVNGDNRLDVAQSFQPQTTNTLNKVSFKLQKFGSPPDVTVRVLGDNGGNPDKNTVLASGTLYSSLVTSTYGWVDVTFSTTPSLTAGTTYWLMIDTFSNSANYWSWQNDLAQSYNRGSPKWSPDWNTGNPDWNSFSGDLSFRIYLGGVINSITGDIAVNMDAHANTLNGLTVGRDAYYQSIINTTVSGSNCTDNSHCHPGFADPPPKVFPISDANISQWKTDATNSNSNLASPVCGSTWGPGKYTGDVTLNNNCTVTVRTPIWITGNLTMNNDNIFRLESSYGTTSGLILVDGLITLQNNNHLEGSGSAGSILMLLSTYDSKTNGITAVDIQNNGNTGVFYAGSGIVSPGNNNQFVELTAWKIKLFNNSTINYQTGLSSTLFSSGPSGSFSLIGGTYQLK